MDEDEWQFLVTGGVSVESPSPNPASQWLSDKSWAQLVRCSDLPALKGLSDHVTQNVSKSKFDMTLTCDTEYIKN